MSLEKDDNVYLWDMLTAARAVESFVKNVANVGSVDTCHWYRDASDVFPTLSVSNAAWFVALFAGTSTVGTVVAAEPAVVKLSAVV